MNWRAKVYKPGNDPSVVEPQWAEKRARVIQRDGGICRACGQADAESAHHIRPRAQGGTDHMRNLIALCNPCHDYIEPLWERYRMRRDIVGACQPVEMPERQKGSTWQSVVYGGCRNPWQGN